MKTRFCKRAKKVSFLTELDAKIALAWAIAKERGEIRYYRCGRHYHLTSQPERTRPQEGEK